MPRPPTGSSFQLTPGIFCRSKKFYLGLGSPCPRENLRELQVLFYEGLMSNFSFQVKSEITSQKQKIQLGLF